MGKRFKLIDLTFLYKITYDRQHMQVSVLTQRSAACPPVSFCLIFSSFQQIRESHSIMANLLFGSGLRLMACIRLRVKDIDFDRKRIHILGKGDKSVELAWQYVFPTKTISKDPRYGIQRCRKSWVMPTSKPWNGTPMSWTRTSPD